MRQIVNFKFIWLAFIAIKTAVISADSLSISGNPATMSITTATAGSQPNGVTDTSTTYGVSTTIVVRSITGSINTSMPTGTTLQVQLAAPAGATSTGNITMTTTAQNLVTSIPILTLISNPSVTYTFSATVAAAPVTNGSVTLTLTLQ